MLLLTGQNFVQIQCQYQIEKSIKNQHENSSYYEVLVVWRIWMDVRIHVVVQMDKLEKKKKKDTCVELKKDTQSIKSYYCLISARHWNWKDKWNMILSS